MSTATDTVIEHKRAVAPVVGFKVIGDAADGVYEAVVSVFDNVDFGGDKVKAGAFAGTLDRWSSSGDPIPVIFSHRWDDVASHIGIVKDAAELAPGDARLPDVIKDLGGLWTVNALDVDEDPAVSFAGRVWRLMQRRSLREFSFAYDVLKARPNDGVRELLELDLFEVGPTLLGMNPLTQLLSRDRKAAMAADLGVNLGNLDRVLERITLASLDEDDLEVDADEEDETTDEAAATDEGQEDDEDDVELEAKAGGVPRVEGSLEETITAVREAAAMWAELEVGDIYYLHLEATLPDDGEAIVVAERWSDPYGEGPVYRLSYSLDEDGIVTIDDAEELEVFAELRPAASRQAEAAGALVAANATKDATARATVIGGAKSEPKAKAEEATTRSGTPGPTPATAMAMASVIDLE